MNLIFDLIYLSACALHQVEPNIDGIDIKEVIDLADKHGLSGLIFSVLSYVEDQIPKEIYANLQNSVNQIIHRLTLLDIERENILSFLEENHIWYMPLKGVILKDIYPEYGMRDMCDNDILYDGSKRDLIMDYFLSRGYETDHYIDAPDDDFLKPPVYNFEMHRALFSTREESKWIEYYKDIKERLIKDDDNSYGYHFSDEDFYVYMMLHARKHLNNAGVGFRALVDCYVYIQNKELDWDYIEKQEENLGFLEIEMMFRELSLKLLKTEILSKARNTILLTSKEEDFLTYLCVSGTYGNPENLIDNTLKKKSTFKYMFERLFPDMKWYEHYVPFVYKHKVLIPFYWAWRTVTNILFDNKKLISELKRILNKERAKKHINSDAQTNNKKNTSNAIEQELEANHQCYFQTVGDSMEPILHNRKSTVVIKKVDGDLKPCDVALYRRPTTGAYVLHRVVSVHNTYYRICGDNRVYEERVPKDWILGYMIGFFPDESENYITCEDEKYKEYVKRWVKHHRKDQIKTIPIRFVRKAKRLIKRIIKR